MRFSISWGEASWGEGRMIRASSLLRTDSDINSLKPWRLELANIRLFPRILPRRHQQEMVQMALVRACTFTAPGCENAYLPTSLESFRSTVTWAGGDEEFRTRRWG